MTYAASFGNIRPTIVRYRSSAIRLASGQPRFAMFSGSSALCARSAAHRMRRFFRLFSSVAASIHANCNANKAASPCVSKAPHAVRTILTHPDCYWRRSAAQDYSSRVDGRRNNIAELCRVMVAAFGLIPQVGDS